MANNKSKAAYLAGLFVLAIVVSPFLTGFGTAYAEEREWRPRAIEREPLGQDRPRVMENEQYRRQPPPPGQPNGDRRNPPVRRDDRRPPQQPALNRQPPPQQPSVNRRPPQNPGVNRQPPAVNQRPPQGPRNAPGRYGYEYPSPRDNRFPAHGGPGVNNQRPPRPDRYRAPLRQLPPRHREFWHRGRKYHYSDGHFYEWRSALGYFLITAPLGAIINSLPNGYNVYTVGGTPYYYYDGTYYQRVPNGYVVVEQPAGVGVAGVSRPEELSGYVVVKPELLVVRQGPNINTAVVVMVKRGEELEARGREGSWLYVRTRYNTYGWVYDAYVAPVYTRSGRW